MATTLGAADPACVACISAACCPEYDALGSDMNVTAYIACVAGPNLNGTGGCFAAYGQTADLAAFQACWEACIDANPEGAQTDDQFNLCIAQNGCIEGDETCEAEFLFTPGACDSGFTLDGAVCDACMGEKCCAGLGACLLDSTCDADFKTCTQDGTQPECATDAAAGVLATCGRDNCATACGFAPGDGVGGSGSVGGGSVGGSGGAGGGTPGRGGAGGHGGG